jgi:branched-chain amino acid aminotransferase
MDSFASVNGTIVPADEARVSVLDTGFTFGDGVYETLRTYRGRPFHLDRHLARLRGSASRVGIEVPVRDEVLAARLDALLERAANPESYIRILITRGVGDITYRFDRVRGPTIVLVVREFEPPPESAFSEGVPVVIASTRRNHPRALDPAIKSCNLLNNILAVREAQAKGAAEAILLNDLGELAEGASSNLFLVKSSTVLTPPLDAGILPGITRAVVLELAPGLGLTTREQPLRGPELLAADEAFVTSTVREVLPIRSVDGTPIGGGRPGPVTGRLLQALREYAPSHCG